MAKAGMHIQQGVVASKLFSAIAEQALLQAGHFHTQSVMSDTCAWTQTRVFLPSRLCNLGCAI
eukprot:12422200-Karenia_brevis.AAC.1